MGCSRQCRRPLGTHQAHQHCFRMCRRVVLGTAAPVRRKRRQQGGRLHPSGISAHWHFAVPPAGCSDAIAPWRASILFFTSGCPTLHPAAQRFLPSEQLKRGLVACVHRLHAAAGLQRIRRQAAAGTQRRHAPSRRTAGRLCRLQSGSSHTAELSARSWWVMAAGCRG